MKNKRISTINTSIKTILVTGALGNMGSYLMKHFSEYLNNKYNIIFTDLYDLQNKQVKNFITADLSDIEIVRKIFKENKIDIVVHLAAQCSKETPWEDLLPSNIIVPYNVFQVSAEISCERVVFASSINSVNNYKDSEGPIKTSALPNPKSLYGTTKLWGEALGKRYSTEENLSVICIRFGRITDINEPRIKAGYIGEEPFPSLDRLISFEDAAQLIARSVEAPDDLDFFIAHGVSDNEMKRLDISDTKSVLGYKPKDDFYKVAKNES